MRDNQPKKLVREVSSVLPPPNVGNHPLNEPFTQRREPLLLSRQTSLVQGLPTGGHVPGGPPAGAPVETGEVELWTDNKEKRRGERIKEEMAVIQKAQEQLPSGSVANTNEAIEEEKER